MEVAERFLGTEGPARSRVRDRNSRRILEVARTFVESFGLEELSMRRLAREADVSVRTLYNLFGDKGGLVTAFLRYSLDATVGAVNDVVETDPIERIWKTVTISVESTVGYVPKVVAAAAIADEQLYEQLDYRSRGRELIAEEIRSATKAGALGNDVPAEVLVDHAEMVYRELIRRWATGEIDDAALCARVLHAFDVTLLAVANPQTRTRLLEHSQGLRRRDRSVDKQVVRAVK
jgi:AcrR family transcriptional regulator